MAKQKGKSGQEPRKPAVKSAHLRKKMQQQNRDAIKVRTQRGQGR